MRPPLLLFLWLACPVAASAQSTADTRGSSAADAASTSAVADPGPATLALLPLDATGLEPSELAAWQRALANAAASAGERLLAGEELAALLPSDLMSGEQGCLDADCLAEVGLALAVPVVLAGQLSRMQDELLVHIKRFDVASRATTVRVYETLVGEESADNGRMAAVAERLVSAGPAADAVAAVEEDVLPLELLENAEDPVILQALALEAEVDGNHARALGKLRAALALDPTDASIAYDLARVAFERDGSGFAADAAPFLALDSPTPDAKLLRARILARRGERQDAALEVARVLEARPGDREALRLQAALGRSELPTERSTRISASVRTAVLYDSNVLVLPESVASEEAGVRGEVGGNLGGRFELGRLRLDAGGFFRVGAHATNRAALDAYDSLIGGASLGARYAVGSVQLGLAASHSQVFLDLAGSHFMQTTGGRLEARLPVRPVRVSAYVEGAYRDFVDTNAAVEETVNDRDGPRVVAGAEASWRSGILTLHASGGYLAELAQGERQEVRGAVGSVRTALRLKPVRISAGSTYEYRHYWRYRRGTRGVPPHKRRTDHRFTPRVRVTVPIIAPLSAVAAYSFVLNDSRRAFAYTRHVGQLGVMASW